MPRGYEQVLPLGKELTDLLARENAKKNHAMAEIRSVVARFAKALTEKLSEPQNLRKSGWRDEALWVLLLGLRKELRECETAIDTVEACMQNDPKGFAKVARTLLGTVYRETLDVAAFGSFIEDPERRSKP